jgi:alpha-1,3-rhamnosyl/mannosyltransferase
MPPLEALACGVPTIVGDNSSLPEVIDDKNARVPSDDLPALIKKMTEYLEGIDKKTAETLTEGPKRARDFSWQKSAQVFLDVVEELS